VIGVSPDPPRALAGFADKHRLRFTLPADVQHSVANAYGTWVKKPIAGKTYWGGQRATFIIGPDGRIARVFPKVSPKTHDEVVLGALGELAAA
jgi:thioredoxin-dependent peroxiredoxin